MGSPIDGSRVAYPASPDSALALAIVRLTGLPVAVLFRGEPGGGRRWVASTLHRRGRANAPLVEVDGAQLAERGPENQQAELRAACERAAGGSLLLDEPGRLVPSVQIAVAERIDLGSRCATRFLFVSSDPEDWPLRRPLRDRLITVDLPPLRTRDADLPRLLDHYLELHSRDQGLELPWGIERALAYLRGYRWPAVLGDIDSFAAAAVRQRDARVAARQEVRRLTGAAADDWGRQPKRAALDALHRGQSVRLKEVRRLVVRDAESSWLARTLESVAGDRRRAAALLGISYKALSAKLRAMAPLHPSR